MALSLCHLVAQIDRHISSIHFDTLCLVIVKLNFLKIGQAKFFLMDYQISSKMKILLTFAKRTFIGL